jgi:uncharacterized membrane protein
MPEETPQNGLNDNAAGALAYFTFIPAIIFLVTAPYNQKPAIRFHAWQSIFLTAVAIVAWICQMVLMIIPFIGWLIAFLIFLALLAIWILCVVNAFNGKSFKLPIIGDLAAKQAGV